jgi:nucleoside-diphosphate-sugar epimerase
MKKLFIFGFGYVAQFLASSLKKKGWEIGGTTRDPIKAESLKRWGYDVSSTLALPEGYDHILYSIPPSPDIDLTFLKPFPDLKWFGYLSATSVYGDHQGNWVTEETPPNPLSIQGKNRLKDEKSFDLPLHIFRLSGIYGPKRNTLESVRAGKAQRIDKPGHFISRIHVDDIVRILEKSLESPTPGEIFNLSDAHPCPSREVIEYASQLLHHPLSPLIPYHDDLPEHMRRFYEENKRVDGTKALRTFDLTLKYPSYKEGLGALL